MSNRGFTLVELSIVLVILGLLVGGVLSGQSLIHAAQLRAVSTEFDRYVAATHTFRDKYFAIPGDMTNATSFWGTAASCPGDQTTPSTDTTTCNGNGDGFVMMGSPGGGLGLEAARFWQQLANAGLIEGHFTGVNATSGGFATVQLGSNIPASKFPNAGWSISSQYGSYYAGDANTFPGNYGNALFFGAAATAVNNMTIAPAMKPEDAWNLDTKMDDGLPGQGKIVTWRSPLDGSCATSDDPAVAVYMLSTPSVACSLIFRASLD